MIVVNRTTQNADGKAISDAVLYLESILANGAGYVESCGKLYKRYGFRYWIVPNGYPIPEGYTRW